MSIFFTSKCIFLLFIKLKCIYMIDHLISDKKNFKFKNELYFESYEFSKF